MGPRRHAKHMMTAHKIEVEVPCTWCEEVLPNPKEFTKHFKTWHRKQIQCQFCGKEYGYLKVLEEHIAQHHSEQPSTVKQEIYHSSQSNHSSFSFSFYAILVQSHSRAKPD